MLTDGQIREAIEKKKIIVDPFNESDLKAGKYNLHLGNLILVPRSQDTVVNPLDPATTPQYTEVNITNNPYILKPGEFILGQTQERIGLDSDMAVFLDGSSTIARVGITIHQSDFFIPPGQDPHIITLEIYNAGPWKIQLYFGMRIGKFLAFQYETENTIAEKTFNKYGAQQKTTGANFA